MPSPDSKINFALLRDRILSQNGKEYWRSLEEYADTPEFKEFVSREYPHEIEEWDSSLSRRNFVKVMGASLALAGLTGCVIQPTEKIVPYVNSQIGLLPGKSNYFATAMSLGGVAVGLLAKSYDGRPIKVEGNPASGQPRPYRHPRAGFRTRNVRSRSLEGGRKPWQSKDLAGILNGTAGEDRR